MFIENIDTIYSNIFTKKHRFLEENKIIGGANKCRILVLKEFAIV